MDREKRLISFLFASTAFFLVFVSLQTLFAPPQPPVAQGEIAEESEASLDEPDTSPDVDIEAGNSSAGGDPNAPADEADGDSEEASVAPPAGPKWSTLGSLDPNAGYDLLVTINNLGSGIERIELTERDEDGRLMYRRVDVTSGYLGYFAGEPASSVDGMVVNVVGPGSPGYLAGVEVGDIITNVNGTSVRGRTDIYASLEKTKPGDIAELTVLRGDGAVEKTLTAELTEHPLDLVRLASDGGADQVAGNADLLSCLVTLSAVNRKSLSPDATSLAPGADPASMRWNVLETDEGSANFELELSNEQMKLFGGQRLKLRREYRLEKDSFDLAMNLRITNASNAAQKIGYRLGGINGVTLEGWWYSTKISPTWGGAAARDLIFKSPAEGHELISGFTLLKQAKKQPKDPAYTLFAPDSPADAQQLNYIGVDAQYFTAAYLPMDGQSYLSEYRRAAGLPIANVNAIPANQERAINTSFYLDSQIADLSPGQEINASVRIFAGPKKPELLAAHGLQDAVYYGWFSWLSKPLANLLHALYAAFANYGLAIIALTVIVRGAMFPLSRKAAVNAQKMQELAPEFKKIADKYGDDLQARMLAQRELQQRVGFNPMAGCLPMFLQLPIFMGLYRALSVDIELRQQPLFQGMSWASNLAGPDMFSYWGDWLWEYLSGRGTGWLGPYFNVFPVIVVGLFLLQQKLFMPPATDEQTRMTQKMMNFMTLFMGLFFFRAPAGLCLYFITSSLWGICERVLVKKTVPQKTHFDPAMLDGGDVVEGEARPKNGRDASPTNDGESLTSKIRDRITKPEPEFVPPKKRKRPPKSR
ncbi:MAG: YidC/Oxa1 family insertase periplasmic-domain containing protein [Planctomycetota bacterium]